MMKACLNQGALPSGEVAEQEEAALSMDDFRAGERANQFQLISPRLMCLMQLSNGWEHHSSGIARGIW